MNANARKLKTCFVGRTLPDKDWITISSQSADNARPTSAPTNNLLFYLRKTIFKSKKNGRLWRPSAIVDAIILNYCRHYRYCGHPPHRHHST